AVADAGLRHREPYRLRLHRRPYRRRAHVADRLGAARHRAAALSDVRWFAVALHHFGAVRLVPGRNRAELRDYRTRIFPRARSRHARRIGDAGNARRHGIGRLAVRRHFRLYRLLPGGLPQWDRMESHECLDHDLAAHAIAPPDIDPPRLKISDRLA